MGMLITDEPVNFCFLCCLESEPLEASVQDENFSLDVMNLGVGQRERRYRSRSFQGRRR